MTKILFHPCWDVSTGFTLVYIYRKFTFGKAVLLEIFLLFMTTVVYEKNKEIYPHALL